MKKFLILPALFLLFSGCEREKTRFEKTFIGCFDTVTTVVGYEENEEAFLKEAERIGNELFEYHRLFDIYKEYEGINNLYYVNLNAGISPVNVSEDIIDLLDIGLMLYRETEGKTNIFMGAVTKLWKEAAKKDTPNPPSESEIKTAGENMSPKSLVINREEGTVFIKDEGMAIDVGAIAKGWAAEKVRKTMKGGYLLSVGGNVCSSGGKGENEPWIVGVKDPKGGESAAKIRLSGGSVVTSGDYERYFEVNGKKYHHIIDPETLYPSDYWASVTVFCHDSAVADGLSTALFSMDRETGEQIAEKFGADIMWIGKDGEIFYTAGLYEKLE